MKPLIKLLSITGVVILAGALMAGCAPSGPIVVTEDLPAKQTSVAATVAAILAEETRNAPTATNTPPPTPTSLPPTATFTLAAPSATATLDTTQPAGTITPITTQAGAPTATNLASPTATRERGNDAVTFISDITYPDYTIVVGGSTFTKTWRLQNTGTSTWTTDYKLVFQKGDRMGAPEKVNFPNEVRPNAFLDISIDFTAPTASGEYSSYWLIENDLGEQFGMVVNQKDKQPIWTIIVVQNATNTGGNNGGSSTTTAGLAGGATITNATVTVDKANFTGKCPANLNFTYTVTTSNAGKIEYQLVLTALTPAGYKFDATPQNAQTVGDATTISAPYLLISSNSVSAQAKVIAKGANSFTSPTISFTITCD